MNQILTMEDKRDNSKSIDFKIILKVFSIILVIFGLAFVGQGSYGIYKEAKGRNAKNLPIVDIARVNDTVIVKVNSSYEIKNLVYNFNDSEKTVKEVNNNYVEEEIVLPIESSVLNIEVEDETGRTIKYAKEFNLEGIDISKPLIDVREENVGSGNIKITATDEKGMSYITYVLNDEDEVRIDKVESESTTMNYTLKLPKGENRLTIKAADISGNIATWQKQVIISGKPSVSLKLKNGRLVVIAKDAEGIKDIEINLNGVAYSAKNIKNKTVTVTIPQDLADKNTVKLKITNVNSIVTEGTKEF